MDDPRAELSRVLDYILNRAGSAELEVIAKALERRRQDMGRYAGMGGLNPGAMANRMAASINEGVQSSMESLRGTVRSYVEGIIRRQAPEASEQEIEALLDHYVGQAEGLVEGLVDVDDRRRTDEGSGLRLFRQSASDPTEPDLPSEALLLMVRDFCDYSLGLMPPSRQQELWETLDAWQEKYWTTFPAELKSLIKARLEERLDEERFWRAVLTMLGL